MPKTLTDKQEMFVEEYLKCFNATQAAKNAGYSEKTAGKIGSENLSKPDIDSRIRARMKEAAMSADECLFHLATVARGQGFDKVRALELIGKSHKLFVERVEHDWRKEVRDAGLDADATKEQLTQQFIEHIRRGAERADSGSVARSQEAD